MTSYTREVSENSNISLLSDEQLIAICEFAEVISCKCPSYLVGLLQQVKQFRCYTTECINIFPEDTSTHERLLHRALHVETYLCETIFQLLEEEGLLNEHGQPDLERLGAHSRTSTALQQMAQHSNTVT